MVLLTIIELSIALVDGLGDTSNVSRTLQIEKAEFAEWILLDGVSDSLHGRFRGIL